VNVEEKRRSYENEQMGGGGSKAASFSPRAAAWDCLSDCFDLFSFSAI
jgi:hypothetical protein